MDSILSCRRLWKVFGETPDLSQVEGSQVAETCAAIKDKGGVVACADINLEIERGEFFVLMGLSGSGKSTLLRCLSRLSEPTSGSILVDGEDLLALNDKQLMDVRRHKMGMVFQHFGLFPHMTVEENVAFPLKVQGVPEQERLAKAREMIALVGLEGRETAMTEQLSGGQKQRVGIARSLAVDPELWFLDEPFSALDPLIRNQMQGELKRLEKRLKKTIVFVTHDFMEAVRLADRIAIMKDGRFEQVGRPSDIVLNPATDYVADFVAEVPRASIISLENLMQPCEQTIDSERCLPASTPLSQVLAMAVDGGGMIGVKDEAGTLIGGVSPQSIASALSGQRV